MRRRLQPALQIRVQFKYRQCQAGHLHRGGVTPDQQPGYSHPDSVEPGPETAVKDIKLLLRVAPSELTRSAMRAPASSG